MLLSLFEGGHLFLLERDGVVVVLEGKRLSSLSRDCVEGGLSEDQLVPLSEETQERTVFLALYVLGDDVVELLGLGVSLEHVYYEHEHSEESDLVVEDGLVLEVVLVDGLEERESVLEGTGLSRRLGVATESLVEAVVSVE